MARLQDDDISTNDVCELNDKRVTPLRSSSRRENPIGKQTKLNHSLLKVALDLLPSVVEMEPFGAHVLERIPNWLRTAATCDAVRFCSRQDTSEARPTFEKQLVCRLSDLDSGQSK